MIKLDLRNRKNYYQYNQDEQKFIFQIVKKVDLSKTVGTYSIKKFVNSIIIFLITIFISLPINATSSYEYDNSFDSNLYNQYNNNFDAYQGYTLFAPEYTKNTYLMDNNGTIINLWKSDYIQALGHYLMEDSNLIRTCAKINPNPYFIEGGYTGRVEIFDWNGSLIWEYNLANETTCLHHDIEVLPNGNILMIAWEKKDSESAINAGRDPEITSSNEIWFDYIIEVDPTGTSGGTIVWEWHVWDHLIQEYDAAKENYGIISDHPELININYMDTAFARSDIDLTHINSIDYNEELDQILLTVNNYCEIWIIDHSTTVEEAASHTGGRYDRGGDLLYRWGNPQTYNRGAPSDQKVFGIHNAEWIKSIDNQKNHITYFSNGIQRPEGSYSSVEEIIVPINEHGSYEISDNSPYDPVEPIWIYTSTIKTDFMSPRLSGVQRLPNGNSLICDGVHGYFFEVTNEKEIVWEYQNDLLFIKDDVFHIHRYPLDYEGIGYKKLLNPEKPNKPTGETNLLTANEYSFATTSIDPNNENVYYLFDWGDGTQTGWIGPYESGREIVFTHIWRNEGLYTVKAKARNSKNIQSKWSESLNISVLGHTAWIIGSIDSKTINENEISFWTNKLSIISFNPFQINTYPLGIYMVVSNEYKGILTNKLIIGKFSIIQI